MATSAPDNRAFSSTRRLDGISIRQRLGHYSRSRILVEPLLWTELHLDLLSCDFIGPSPAPPDVIMKLEYPGDERRLRSFKSEFCPGHGNREGGMRALLGGSEVPLQWFMHLELRFGDYPGIILPCSYFCLRNECTDDAGPLPPPPIIAHIDQGHIAFMRKRKIQSLYGRSARYNRPGAKLASLRLKRLVPTEPLREPYLVAVLIALAQQQWRTLGPATIKRVSGVRSKLLYTSVGPGGDALHLYSTTVSSTFLAMVDNVAFVPPTPQSLSIQLTAIPFEPLDTLRNRLMALILEAPSLEAVGNSRDLVACP